MSLGYAEKLSYKEDIGKVGMVENFDSSLILHQKITQLASLIQQSTHLVAFTGAGISTSSGIPDFRGPNGIWTLQKEGKDLPSASLPFHRAKPSLTHMALVQLEKLGILKFVISQNVDSLHLRSGIPRAKLAELHGNSFMEVCVWCEEEYLRDFEVESIGLKVTSRKCKCGAKLRDTVLDWDDALPEKEMKEAEKHCKMADVVLCLGTSLQVTPACNLPLRCVRGGGKVVIVNLQNTPKDKKASLVIHGRVDEVIAGVFQLLNMKIPPYVRIDLVQIVFKQFRNKGDKRYVRWSVRLSSVHGEKAPFPFIESIEFQFPEMPELKGMVLDKQPFEMKRPMLKEKPANLVLKLNFGDGCGCPSTTIEFPLNFQLLEDSYKKDKDVVLTKLRDTAIQDFCCGQHAILERKTVRDPRSDVSVAAIVTNLIEYDNNLLKPKANGVVSESNGIVVKRSCNGNVDETEVPLKRPKGC